MELDGVTSLLCRLDSYAFSNVLDRRVWLFDSNTPHTRNFAIPNFVKNWKASMKVRAFVLITILENIRLLIICRSNALIKLCP